MVPLLRCCEEGSPWRAPTRAEEMSKKEGAEEEKGEGLSRPSGPLARGVEAGTPGEGSRLELSLRRGEERCLSQVFV